MGYFSTLHSTSVFVKTFSGFIWPLVYLHLYPLMSLSSTPAAAANCFNIGIRQQWWSFSLWVREPSELSYSNQVNSLKTNAPAARPKNTFSKIDFICFLTHTISQSVPFLCSVARSSLRYRSFMWIQLCWLLEKLLRQQQTPSRILMTLYMLMMPHLLRMLHPLMMLQQLPSKRN